MYAVYVDLIHPLPPLLQTHRAPSRPPSGSFSCLFLFLNTLSPITAAPYARDVMPTTTAWATYQGAHPWKKRNCPPSSHQ